MNPKVLWETTMIPAPAGCSGARDPRSALLSLSLLISRKKKKKKKRINRKKQRNMAVHRHGPGGGGRGAGRLNLFLQLSMRARTGTAQLPLHGGKAPAWLFSRMVKLAREISVHIVSEFGPDEMLRRLSDPFWFQAFGCVLGFDWHSSGVTTTVTRRAEGGHPRSRAGARVLRRRRQGRGTPGRLPPRSRPPASGCDRPRPLVYASRMSAKVDSAAVQDGYQLYHHAFFFTPAGDWCVVQQGMNDDNGMARRYHWLSTAVRATSTSRMRRSAARRKRRR